MTKKPNPTQAQLREALHYDPKTGKLFWKKRPISHFNPGKLHTAQHNMRTWNSRYAGTEAFASKNGHGYHQSSVFDRKYEAQRVIYAWMTGEWPETVDHEDGDPTNNRWRNLKGKTRAENQKNLGMRKTNRHGFTGITQNKDGRWRALVYAKGTTISLGIFDLKEDAIARRLAANEKMGFHKNHGERKSTAARKAAS